MATNQHLMLFHKSVLKQAKWRRIQAFLGQTAGLQCVDLGGDNGVISLLLRQQGGTWHSGDLDAASVAAIHEAVEENTFQTDGCALPFADASQDLVVIIDMLEHVRDDLALLREVRRILRPQGRLILNVPHHGSGSVLRRLRKRLGLTDEWHGHLRPGYSLDELAVMTAGMFRVLEHRYYNRLFSELLDIALNWTYLRKSGRPSGSAAKGTIIGPADTDRFQSAFRWYSRLYPAMWLFAKLDLLDFWNRGFHLIVSAECVPKPSAPAPGP